MIPVLYTAVLAYRALSRDTPLERTQILGNYYSECVNPFHQRTPL